MSAPFAVTICGLDKLALRDSSEHYISKSVDLHDNFKDLGHIWDGIKRSLIL